MKARERKIIEVENLSSLIKKYSVIGLADLTSLPSAQLQFIRKKLKEHIEVRVAKKSVIKRALEKNNKLNEFKQYLDKSIPALILSNTDPFKLYKLFKENKSNVAAKPGQLSPSDIIIPAGPTNFPPGPIIGELGAVGLATAVEAGKIAIKKEKLIVRQNEIIKPEIASVLGKLGIEPIEIKMNIAAFYKEGAIYEGSLLDIDEEAYLNELKLAYMQALQLALEIDYISRDNAEVFVSKAYASSLSLSKKLNIEVNQDIIKIEKTKVKSDNAVGYNKNAEKVAQDLLRELQDKKIQEESKPKQKSMWD